MVCKFKNNFEVIIANIHLLYQILSRETLFRLCKRLYIDIPPLLGLYTKGDEKIKEEFEKKYSQYRLIEYDEEDDHFPERYIHALKELYPDVVVDVNKATETWLKGEETKELIEARKWLEQEGFIEPGEKISQKEDYRKMYFKLKKRYDELLSYVKKLAEFAKNE